MTGTSIITQAVRPNGIQTSYQYNDNNWLTQIEHKGSSYRTSYAYDYDKVGNRLNQIEEDEAQTSYSYDAFNRLVKVDYPKDKIESIKSTYYQPSEQPKNIKIPAEFQLAPPADEPQDKGKGNDKKTGAASYFPSSSYYTGSLARESPLLSLKG